MLINDNTRFPYPVLLEGTDDFTDGSFHVDIEIPDATGRDTVEIEYKATLEERSIKSLVAKGQAACGLFVVCEQTAFDKLLELEIGDGELKFTPGALLGRVTFRPVVYAKKPCQVGAGIHPEFGAKWDYRSTDFMAIGEESQVEIGLDKLVPMKTIFSIEENNDVPDNEMRVLLDRDQISILLNAKSSKKIHLIRQNSRGRAMLYSSVYMPALIQVLDSIKGSDQDYAALRWFQVLVAKCNDLGIDKDQPNLLEDAQKLLSSPLSYLFDHKEFASDE